jgi:hypothetical protein
MRIGVHEACEADLSEVGGTFNQGRVFVPVRPVEKNETYRYQRVSQQCKPDPGPIPWPLLRSHSRSSQLRRRFFNFIH